MTTDHELKQAFNPDYVAQAGHENSDKRYSAIFANGDVKFLRANGANQAQRFANEYAERILRTTVLFVTIHRGG
jgi:hypothetical protein